MTQGDMVDEDLIILQDDNEPAAGDSELPWSILIVDDDEQVHEVTRFALEGRRVLGRPLRFQSARSAEEARELLAQQRYSLILLDVVMEAEDSGLKLVGEIRGRFGDPAVRIVLRTGQPGFAPELEVIQHYDINDYRSKSELTSQRLLTSLTSALRSYEQICTIEASRAGLARVLDAASELLSIHSLETYTRRVLAQICGMLELPLAGVICLAGLDPAEAPEGWRVLAAAGAQEGLVGGTLGDWPEAPRRARIAEARRQRRSVYAEHHLTLVLESSRLGALLIDLDTPAPLPELSRRLLDLYAINALAGLDNTQLIAELENYAFRDGLTGLGNRTALEQELQRRCALGLPYSLLLIDIDNFQAVNDGLGHEVGDQTLKHFAAILTQVFPVQGFVARIAADSFGIIVPEHHSAESLLTALHRRLERNLAVGEHLVPVNATAGIARFPEHGDASALFRNAGMALKQAKRQQRGGYRCFDNRFEQELRQRLEIVRELRASVDHAGLRLMYQPQRRLGDGKLYGVEALLRWERAPGELLGPDRFIAAAEESGQIVRIGAWVLLEACRQQRRWLEQGRDVCVAVNVSPRQIREPGFAVSVEAALADTGIRPDRLELEVTESLLLDEGERAAAVFGPLRQRGVRIAIDDFGTGHSSLGRLQQLPLDRLKIDRSFITEIDRRAENRVIAELVIKLGHALGLAVLAEGVETEAQEAVLRSLGCDEVQGYRYGRPMWPDEVLKLPG